MAIWACTGRFGAGKSAIGSYLAIEEHRRRMCDLWANYGLIESIQLYSVPELYDCEDGVIILDELQGTAHSRSAMSKSNAAFNEWFDQCRKQGNELFIISQQLTKMDKQIRDNINFEFACRDLGNYYSEVNLWDLETNKKVRNFIFDRRWAFGLYDHRKRARGLLVERPAPVSAEGEQAPIALPVKPARSRRVVESLATA